MKLPNELTSDVGFMTLLRLATQHVDATTRADIESIVAMAYMGGETAGIKSTMNIFFGKREAA
jgi:hypothetical protein